MLTLVQISADECGEMAESSHQSLLGRLAVRVKLINMRQLELASREQGKRGDAVTLGEVLVEMGFVTPSELERLLQLQKNVLARQAEATAPETSPAVAAPQVAITSAGTPPGALVALLSQAVSAGASDVHVHAGSPLRFRVRDTLVPHSSEALDRARAEKLVHEALTDEEKARLEHEGEVDFCFVVPGIGRFRGNAYRQLHGLDATFRHVPPEAPTLARLGLPTTLARLVQFHNGMVLVTGPARCGKTSTMAALVRLINEERGCHVVSIEDPIEFLHPSRRAIVNQRSVGRHTESFARALRAALREDPDVIVIGELRDAETIGLALTAAETGHFVLGTLHTDGAIRTVDRLVGVFPPNQQEQVRTMLAESLRAVVSQRLIVSADGGRMLPALEVLVVNRATAKLIRDDKTFQLQSVLQTGAAQGMCLMDESIARLLANGSISREEALRHCMNPRALGGN
jgi:twitching motility protein PilT